MTKPLRVSMPEMNPYAAPQSTAHSPAPARRSGLPVAIEIAFSSVFFVLRGVAAGFATLIFLVHSSGTQILWENVVPMLAGIIIGCAVMHWLERWYTSSKQWAFLVAIVAYLVGAVVVTIAGFLQCFPNPF
jgi:hypothetical protein